MWLWCARSQANGRLSFKAMQHGCASPGALICASAYKVEGISPPLWNAVRVLRHQKHVESDEHQHGPLGSRARAPQHRRLLVPEQLLLELALQSVIFVAADRQAVLAKRALVVRLVEEAEDCQTAAALRRAEVALRAVEARPLVLAPAALAVVALVVRIWVACARRTGRCPTLQAGVVGWPEG